MAPRLRLDIDPGTLGRLPVLQTERGRRLLDAYERLDSAIVGFHEEHGLTLLRWTLAIVFIWFGALKVIDRSPVAALVSATVYWLPADFFVRFLGVWELAIGVGLLFGVGMRIVLLLFFLQMAGTFLVFLTQPDEAFDSNPLLLTTLGEFVVKNLVLIAAGLVLGATVRERRQGEGRVAGKEAPRFEVPRHYRRPDAPR